MSAKQSTNQPFYRKDRKGWYLMVTLPNGKRSQRKLGKTRKEAFATFDEIKAAGSTTDPLLGKLLQEWGEALQDQVNVGLLSASRMRNLVSCTARIYFDNPAMKWSGLNPDSLLAWMVPFGWSPDTTGTRIGYFKQFAKWAANKHKLDNAIADMPKPSTTSRKRIVTPGEHRAISAELATARNHHDRRFLLFLVALYYTGARPGELSQCTAADVRGETIVLKSHKNAKKTKKPRTIYLTGCALTAVKIAAARRDSQVFSGRTGAYTKDAIRNRLASLRSQLNLPEDLVAYSYRHAYATRALESGESPAILAELMGTSLAMIERHYGHLEKSRQHLSDAAKRITSPS